MENLLTAGVRWTKHGSSEGLNRDAHGTASPLGPATEVNVPHSCATRPCGEGRVSAPKIGAANKATRAMRNCVIMEPPDAEKTEAAGVALTGSGNSHMTRPIGAWGDGSALSLKKAQET